MISGWVIVGIAVCVAVCWTFVDSKFGWSQDPAMYGMIVGIFWPFVLVFSPIIIFTALVFWLLEKIEERV